MKSVKELQKMLVSELCNSLDRIRTNKGKMDFYNGILGDTSFLIAGLLESLLKLKFDEWDPRKWIDDSLLTNINLNKNKLSIWGVMIWGMENETEQWTEPFYFEIDLNPNKLDFSIYTFLYCDLDNPEISYENFKESPDYWDKQLDMNNNLNFTERNWKYIINIKNELG